MKKKFFLLACCLFVLTGCYVGVDNPFKNENSVHKRANALVNLQEQSTESLPDKYSFVVITDVHFGSIKDNPPPLPETEFLKWLADYPAETRPKFCLALGDVSDTGKKEEYKDYSVFVKKIEELGVKVFNSVGNHDLYQSGWDNWEETCYPHTSFYRFQTSNFSFYALDTGTCNLGPVQLQEFKKAIEVDTRPKIVYTHYPLYTDTFFFCQEDTTERNLLMTYCSKNNVKLFLSGHLHWYEKTDYGNFQAYALPSYRYKGKWTLVTVDEQKKDYSLKVISKNDIK